MHVSFEPQINSPAGH